MVLENWLIKKLNIYVLLYGKSVYINLDQLL